jgi:hypothetical protein
MRSHFHNHSLSRVFSLWHALIISFRNKFQIKVTHKALQYIYPLTACIKLLNSRHRHQMKGAKLPHQVLLTIIPKTAAFLAQFIAF